MSLHSSSNNISGYDSVPVFTPTLEEMADFQGYIDRVVDPACSYGGICKIIPPKEWKPHNFTMDQIDFEIATPVKQFVDGVKGVFQLYLEESKPTTFKKWPKAVTEKAPTLPSNLTTLEEQVEWMERKVWKNVAFQAPLYGSDLYGTLFVDPKTPWNLNTLDSVLSRILKKQGITLPGINSPYLYVGSYKSFFAWHCEDLDLYSINYMHFGSPKVWYTIPFPYKNKFEELVKKTFPEQFQTCSQFLRHKTTLISPFTLKEHGIRVTRVTQLPGEFIITLPGSYHQGFNWDINVNEAVNFATKRWLPIGKVCERCQCDPDTVRINLDVPLDDIDADPLSSSSLSDLNSASVTPFDISNNGQFSISNAAESYRALLLHNDFGMATVPHQLQPSDQAFISKYYDEINASYNYPYNNPTKVYTNQEIEVPNAVKSEFELPEQMKVVAHNPKCLTIRITTAPSEPLEEEEIDDEEYTPTRKKKRNSKSTSSKKKGKKDKGIIPGPVGIVKKEKSSSSLVDQLPCDNTIIKSQHHPLNAKFFARARLLRK
ncbi:hypothetical protein FDP41_011492 [Naegleria fowleri]|uniref:JmjC domain-containing protein n=1 Tax=Naegleria fowleri TaxID=5763 RepID=A0A6A5C6S8_NAEFO|nr:uncharacterized protein FDP41_011492 [Naegleria fowleri]KAF0982562.1 hypothetical protein FDP41_011492 [Naegleria fowleri]CAG4716630.1 unnamed protein product [Naegleria fowleri]